MLNCKQFVNGTHYALALGDPSVRHLGPLIEALNMSLKGSNAQAPATAHAASVLNLSNADLATGDLTRIEFLVEEGLWLYRLGNKHSGWGSAFANVKRARVMIVKVVGDSLDGELLADAEVRTNPGRPWRNAEEIARAAAVLVGQGCLSRPRARPIRLRSLSAPRAGIADMLRWAWHSFVPTLRQSIAWRLGIAPRAQWTIGVLAKAAVESTWQFPWDKVTWLKPPEDGMIADPFLVEENGCHWLFYEHMLYGQTNATLWVGRLNAATGKLSDTREVLRTQHHLSFPNVFKVNDVWYMLPEQAQSGATKLYRSTSFPYLWEECRVLLPDFPGIDPVLHPHGGKWWLFVTHDAAPCVDNNLHLFWSDSIDGEFHPHPMNPISSGLYGSRMAGAILKQGEMLMRPAQDGREGYGHGLVLREIVSLTPSDYVEREVCAWKPERDGRFAHGFHAFHTCGDLLVIDGLRWVKPGLSASMVMIATSEILDGPLTGSLPNLAGL